VRYMAEVQYRSAHWVPSKTPSLRRSLTLYPPAHDRESCCLFISGYIGTITTNT
jgi:hypothetical protein